MEESSYRNEESIATGDASMEEPVVKGAYYGVIRSDIQLDVGSAIKSPPIGGTRGPVKPPTSWLEEQRKEARLHGTAIPSDDVLKRKL